ncbi:MAG: hypothetical protein ACU836_05120 [Gammaproteobacteria bacterium]
MRWSYSYVFAIVTLTSCVGLGCVQASDKVTPEMTLPLGQSVKLNQANLIIKFKAVPEDSRCPINAFCIMPGNGQVELEIRGLDPAYKIIALNTHEGSQAVTLSNYLLKLVSLNPPRIEGKSIGTADYSVTLSIEKVGSK